MTSEAEGRKDNEQNDEGGKGPEGSIPDSPEGIGASTTDERSNFEPEEDEGADKQ